MVVHFIPSTRLDQQHPVGLQSLGVSQRIGQPKLSALPPPPVGKEKQPLILERTDQDFISGILSELSFAVSDFNLTGVGLKGQVTPTSSQEPLAFYQPVHRVFYVALQEVVCNQFQGADPDSTLQPQLQPRLDPRKIHSAGLVIRRVFEPPQTDSQSNDSPGKMGSQQTSGSYQNAQPNPPPELYERWVKMGETLQGWMSINTDEEDLDPDPTFRCGCQQKGSFHSSQKGELCLFSESHSPMFVAPPNICEATGRTILYGLVPLASAEISEIPAQKPIFEDDRIHQTIIRQILPDYFWSDQRYADSSETHGVKPAMPKQGQMITWQLAQDPNEEFQRLIGTLRQLDFQLNIFEFEQPSAIGHQLYEQLNALTVLDCRLFNEQVKGSHQKIDKLGDFLKYASRILVYQEENLRLKMPTRWPNINVSIETQLVELIAEFLRDRILSISSGEGRFQDILRQYKVRTFVRIEQPHGCPPKIIWSDYSDPFTIAPWYAESPLPPVKVVLPDVFDPKAMANLKPGVSFAVPPALMGFMEANFGKKAKIKDLLGGEGEKGSESEMEWICSFNIPIITLCAFILLNILLYLLNWIFWWLPYVRICFPFPKGER